ncbi:Uncharacterised protein [Mycobacterium tuberculosis]|uniref:Uncharacterized protein n=1 Tax=Mycobacterium tuberculosis TaxID=1773 RepID=A0A654T8Z0_MYCTX|nr:Uncharacterised protein [Mycobacterium tuberculosis]CKR70002.1 Uncharacterised protein [Mycobacterium tuberculosis]CKS90723.1 Uncharacterised protein [Mycobacterium tuberculosis]CNL56703.1 Uncharacterised protein [Mycobacterium tuberculosis]CNL92779.1 Uncharacterised protein [Mycobacterium tuberculosis]
MLSRGDRRVGVLNRALADLQVVFGRGSVVPSGFHVDHRLVNAFLFGLNLVAQVLQALVGLGDVGNQRGDGVRLWIGGSQPRCAYQQGHTQSRRNCRTDKPCGRSRWRATAIPSHSTQIS